MALINYKQCIEHGFKRTNCNDDVFFNQNGYRYFITDLNIKNYTFDWDSTSKKIRLYKNSNVIKELETIQELEFYINLLK
ncbi:MAG TPA: hypothetical protein VIK86_05530 [Candidatus Paceibacterota bacterium]